MKTVSASRLEVVFVPTCSVRFGSLDVKVARFLYHHPDTFLKKGIQPTDIFLT